MRTPITTLASLSLLTIPVLLSSMDPASTESTGSAPTQDVVVAPKMPLVKNLSRASGGLPICGLGKDFHAGRRAELRERLGEGIVVLRGLPKVRDYRTFRQDKNFWYLTGVESPNVCFVMDCKTGREVLFVNSPSARAEIWEGEIWDADDAWVPELTGIAEVKANSSGRRGRVGKNQGLTSVIAEMLEESGGPIWTCQAAHIGITSAYDSAGPYDRARKGDTLDGRLSREAMLEQHLGEMFEVDIKDFSRELYDMRVHKTPEEVAAVRRACVAGAKAMAEGIRSTRPGLGEWDLSALLAWQHQVHGADGDAYAAIAGSGPNSLTLHYNFSSRTMQDGEMILVDYGPEVDHYVTDITRTWPVNGKFTERQAQLYDAVLDAQNAAIAAAKPGVSLDDLGVIANGVLKERGFAEFIRHGVCHHVGMEVHDPGPTSQLQPGACFTVEPGLYEVATNIGIRIEDVVVITEDGCEVLTKDCPRTREEIEALFAEEGILDMIQSR
tara:strand:- start:28687 stop:30180 length:1494 start_codon:yes stop_codon:yes gene_type:complete